MGGKGRAARGGRLRGPFLPISFINDPKHWLKRAEEARTMADSMNDLQSKEAMLRIAQDYERLAKRAEERAKGERP
jgi:hypothetical protein